MKLIKFIMVTALIFILGKAFAQNRSLDEISALRWGTECTTRAIHPDTGEEGCVSTFTCEQATPEDASSAIIECACGAVRDNSNNILSTKYIEYVTEFFDLSDDVESKNNQLRYVCFLFLKQTMGFVADSVHYICSPPTYCYVSHDATYYPGDN